MKKITSQEWSHVMLWLTGIFGAALAGGYVYIFQFILQSGRWYLHEPDLGILRVELSLAVLLTFGFLAIAIWSLIKLYSGKEKGANVKRHPEGTRSV